MLKKLEELKTKIDKIVNEANAQQAPLREAMAKDKAAIAAANNAMEEATTKADLDAYKKAKAEKEDAETSEAMHKARYDAITVKPLMIKEEYNKHCETVFAIIRNEAKKQKAELMKLAEQMNAIAEEATANQATANELLHTLQCDIFKCGDMEDWQKKIGKYKITEDLTPVYLWGKCAINHYQCEEYRKEGGN